MRFQSSRRTLAPAPWNGPRGFYPRRQRIMPSRWRASIPHLGVAQQQSSWVTTTRSSVQLRSPRRCRRARRSRGGACVDGFLDVAQQQSSWVTTTRSLVQSQPSRRRCRPTAGQRPPNVDRTYMPEHGPMTDGYQPRRRCRCESAPPAPTPRFQGRDTILRRSLVEVRILTVAPPGRRRCVLASYTTAAPLPRPRFTSPSGTSFESKSRRAAFDSLAAC